MMEEYEFSALDAAAKWISSAMENVIAAGQWPIIHYFWESRDQHKIFNRRELCKAIERGDLMMVQWLYARHFASSGDPMTASAKHGHLHILQWLYENFHDDEAGATTDVMNHAAENNHLEVVLWLHANRTEGCSDQAMVMAARNGHLQMVQWLHDSRAEFQSKEYIHVNNG